MFGRIEDMILLRKGFWFVIYTGGFRHWYFDKGVNINIVWYS